MNKTSKIIIGLIILGLLIWIIKLSVGSSSQTKEFQTIKLGVIAPSSGPAAIMAEGIQRSIIIASSTRVTAIYQDDQCEAKQAISAYNMLKQQDVRVFYVGCSGSVMALAPLAKQNGDLILTAYAGSAAIRETGTEVIRFIPDALSVTSVINEYLTSQSGKKFVLLHENQDYAKSAADSISSTSASSIIEIEVYSSLDTSYLTILTKIKAAKADGIIWIPVSDVATQKILREMKTLRMTTPIIGEVNLCGYPFSPKDFGIHGICWKAELNTAGYEDFKAAFKEKFGTDSLYPFYDAITYDVIGIIDSLVTSTGGNIQSLKDKILAGVTGKVSSYAFDSNGEVKDVGKYLIKVEF